MPHDRLGWAVAALVLFALLVQTGRLALLRGAPRRRLERARARGRSGERAAAALLERDGYRIDALQPATAWTILCDGEPHSVDLRADLLVSRAGLRFVAEVKTGESAPRLDTATTRRQLLEYSVAYAVDGVLLVDVESERVHQVRFPVPARRSAGPGLLAAAALILAAVLAGLLVRLSS